MSSGQRPGSQHGKGTVVKRFAILISGFLVAGILAHAQVQVGDNVSLRGGGLFTVGYNGAYGDLMQSTHGLVLGMDGNVSGSYYDPNFLNFNITPYYNQSHANSNYQSLTNSSGVAANVNLFNGSHYPGSVSYRYDYNSTGTFGLPGSPDFTTVGRGQGFAVNWGIMLPDKPTFSVGYSHGSGNGTLYGTDESTESSNGTLTLRSSYNWEGFNLNAFYDHLNQHSKFPVFLGGDVSTSDSHGNDFGFGGSHSLPWNGQFYANYTRTSFTTDYSNGVQGQATNSNYTTDVETGGVNFHPTERVSLFANESFVHNLSGYFTQNLVNNGVIPPPLDFGAGSHSYTVGGGAGYRFTTNLSGTAQATYYNQSYLGNSYTGTYISGTVNYNRRLWNTLTFSASVVDSSNGQGNNALGFMGTANAFRHFAGWELSGSFSYAQNVQSVLITYTTSYFNYNANLHRRFARHIQWTAAFNGSHSGLTNASGTTNHSESYATTLAYKRISANAMYVNASGNSVLTNGGLVPVPPVPGEIPSNLVIFSGSSYGGGISVEPLRRLTFSGTFSRSLSNTLSNSIESCNNTELFNLQMRYRIRRIGVQAGFTRFDQGISASGLAPGSVNSFYAGISRWFDFF